MAIVYFEVENTLEVPFITGIQRVTREFSKEALSPNRHEFKNTYIPIIHDHSTSSWRQLNNRELKILTGSKPRSSKLFPRLLNKLYSFLPNSKTLYIDKFEYGSILLDIESTWHSKVKRSDLLPNLKKAGVRIVKIHYDIIPLLFPETTHPNTVKVFSDHFQSHLSYTDLFICISQTTLDDTKQYCQKNSIPSPTLTTIKLGSMISSVKGTNFNSVTCEIYGRYLLAVGTIEPRKNYTMLLRAFEEIQNKSDLNLVIVGKTGWLSDEVLLAIKEHQEYGNRIFHLDNVTDQLLNDLYKNAWLSVIPSQYEGFGLPLVESLARQCPTISSTGGSLKEVGADYVRFFSPDSGTELIQLVLSLNEIPEEYALLKKLASNYQPISWSTTARQIDSILYNACH